MIPTRYNSFDEIDKQLKILNLQREISKESLKLNLMRSKISIYPANIKNELRVLFQRKILLVIAKRFFKDFDESE